jgi:hypothetical protein
MKKLILILLVLTCIPTLSQTTAVTAQVIDNDGQTWNNCTWTLTFIPNFNQPNINIYNQNGTPLSQAVMFQKGSCDASGNLAFTAYQNGTITPVGNSQQLQVCPNSSFKCSLLIFNSGTLGTLNLTTPLTAAIGVVGTPRFAAVAGTYGYADVEAQIQISPGSTYFNVTQGCQRYYNAGSWACPILSIGYSGATLQSKANLEAWGTSLTQGNNGINSPFITTSNWPTQLSLLTGLNVLNQGRGGFSSSQILTLFNADLPNHRNWYQIFEVGTDDGPSYTNVTTNIASMISQLSSSTPYLVLSLAINSVSFPVGSAQYNTMIGVSNTLASTYGSNYLDYWTPLLSNTQTGNALDTYDKANGIVPSSNRTLYSSSATTLLGSIGTATCSTTPINVTGFLPGSGGTEAFIDSGSNLEYIFIISIGSLTSPSYTASITGNVMTVTGVSAGAVAVGQTISGTGIPVGTIITSFGTGSGGNGTYNLNQSAPVGSESITASPGFYPITSCTRGYAGSTVRAHNNSVVWGNWDNIHYSPSGYAFIAQLIYNKISPYFNTIPNFNSYATLTPSINTGGMPMVPLATDNGLQDTALGIGSLLGPVQNGGAQLLTQNGDTAIGYFAMANAIPNNASGNTAVGAQAMLQGGAGGGNVAVGQFAMENDTNGSGNVAIGNTSMFINTSGSSNTAVGNGTLANATSANNNTAIGLSALNMASTGGGNTAVGSGALQNTTTAIQNTAVGWQVLISNTTGQNTAVGAQAEANNTTGTQNTAVGLSALQNNVTSNGNTAVGYNSLTLNTAANNTAIGGSTLNSNVSGTAEVAVGQNALTAATGSNNTAIGQAALQQTTTGTDNTVLGFNAGQGQIFSDGNTTGTFNTWIGEQTGTNTTSQLTNTFALGYQAWAQASNTGTLGNSSVTDVYLGGTSGSAIAHCSNCLPSTPVTVTIALPSHITGAAGATGCQTNNGFVCNTQFGRIFLTADAIFTTGVVATLSWADGVTRQCSVGSAQNSSTGTFDGILGGSPSSTSVAFSTNTTVTSTNFIFDYTCRRTDGKAF